MNAIRINDVVMLVLSESSVNSDWVEHELALALEKERKEERDVLLPIALDESWKAKAVVKTAIEADPDWRPVKKRHVLDFSEWEDDVAFDAAFGKLLRGMKKNYPRGGPS